MNLVDFIIIGALIYYLYDGYKRGALNILMELVIFIISILVAFFVADLLAPILIKWSGLPKSSGTGLAFMLVWLVCQSGLSLLKNYLGKFIPDKLNESKVNRVGGILTSFARGAVFIALILVFITILPIDSKTKNLITKSAIGGRIVGHSGLMGIALRGTFGDSMTNMVTAMAPPASPKSGELSTSRILKPNEILKLGYKTTNVKVDNESELKMLDLVNGERAKLKLTILVPNESLQNVARAHGTDMFARGYFAHINPDKEDPFQRILKAGIDYQVAGENLAMAPNVNMAHTGLMNSPGHRANILESRFGHVGIGVIDGGIYGKIFVQEFKD